MAETFNQRIPLLRSRSAMNSLDTYRGGEGLHITKTTTEVPTSALRLRQCKYLNRLPVGILIIVYSYVELTLTVRSDRGTLSIPEM